MLGHRVRAVAPAALVLSALVASCGGGEAAKSGSASPRKPLTFKVALPVAQAPVGSAIVLGVEGGYFERQGLDVKVTSGLGVSAGNAVIAGQYDIAQLGMASPLLFTSAGKPTTVIYGSTGFGLASNLFARKGITSVAQLKATKPCKIATLTPGTSDYGNASFFNNSLGLGCKLVSYTTAPESTGALAAGRADAASGVIDSESANMAAGKVNLLIDSHKAADRTRYLKGTLFTDVDYFGVTSNLRAKREAVVRFIKGMGEVDKFLRTASPTEIATLLHKNRDYATMPVDTLAKLIAGDRVYMNPYHGYIDEQDWQTGLNALSRYGVKGFDASNPDYAYAKRVDMSYYEQALGKPAQP